MAGSFATRIRIAAKAIAGLVSDRKVDEVYGLLSGLYPASGPLPERGTLELLDGYRTMPWLRAVSYRVAHAVAMTPWEMFRPTRKARERGNLSDLRLIQRTLKGVHRRDLIARALDADRLEPIERHPMLDALSHANDFLVGPSLLFVTQVHLDLPGDAFWIKERNGVGAPVGFWPIPPHWVKETPTIRHPYYTVSWSAWQGKIPESEVLWMSEPNPVNPYGRGSGLGRALADELETDEYAARHTKMTFLNRARPDIIIWPEETKYDSGAIDDTNAKRLGEKWRSEHQGFFRVALPFFATRKLGIKELGQSFNDLQMTELRKHERDIIIQVWGVPPEQLGIIESSNRATIDAADFLMKRNVVQPRLDTLRAYFQERLVPEYDERLIIDYVSPVEADKEYALKAAEKSPWSLMIDEWRALHGHEPLPDGKGQVFMVDLKVQPRATLDYDPPAPAVAPGQPAPGANPKPESDDEDENEDAEKSTMTRALAAMLDAGDVVGARAIRKAMADDPEDLPDLSRAAGQIEPAARRAIADALRELRDATPEEGLAPLLRSTVNGGPPSDAAVTAAVPVRAWQVGLADDSAAWLADGFSAGARVGATAAGLATKEPHPVFNRVNGEAVAWAHRHAGTLVVEVGDATVAGIRAAVATALELGWHPDKLAKVVRETVGLTSAQATAVTRFAERLGGADVELTDARFWKRVEQYADAQRRLRSQTIARTELARASSAGQQRLWDRAVEDGALKKGSMKKTWLVSWDERLEQRCEALSVEEVEIHEPFSNGEMGPPDHPNCRCACGLVSAAKSARAPAVRKRIAPPDSSRAVDWERLIAESVREALGPLVDEPPQLM